MTSFAALPMPLLDGEQVHMQSRGRYLLTTPAGWGYNPINGNLWQTNQRLVFKPDRAITPMQGVILGAAGASLVSFPIRRVTECSEQPMKVQWGKPNVLKLQFDNGGREYFELVGSKTTLIGAWAETIMKAKAEAADLPYDAVPALKSGFELPAGSGARRMMLYWVLGCVALCIVCSVLALVLTGTSIQK